MPDQRYYFQVAADRGDQACFSASSDVPRASRCSPSCGVGLICTLDTFLQDFPEFRDIQASWYPYTLLARWQRRCDRLAQARSPTEGVFVRALCNHLDVEAFPLVIRAGVVSVVFIELNLPFCTGEDSCHGERIMEWRAFHYAEMVPVKSAVSFVFHSNIMTDTCRGHSLGAIFV